ncbi:shikimate dehydrogenase [Helicobacter sp. MIT 21-1697]|uniref:shikimate dehydrogenase n=1 Tax=Helicobacter sp. MIT 21-1697 TaxID=2993733 RepID=UPI00224A9ABB|nr:shikimate dehydrogenase [Helicobacter sp. MIT 21-1697]MCX2717147.1 shikimate dehydrogenase [Helicobacter sp. MIT 21-1697]
MLGFFAVYGNPIVHSKSPFLHNYAFEKLGLSGYYSRILLDVGANLRRNFLSNGLSGANITLPFKEEAFCQCDEVRGVAQNIGACNTWVLESRKHLVGYNTDAQGFYECIKEYKINNALIIGAGGSAKAIAMILQSHNIPTTLINRSAPNLGFFADKGFECYVSSEFKPTCSYDILINTTSAGLNDNVLPCDEAQLKELCSCAKYAFELIYGKLTPFLALAQSFDLVCADGKEMLINQAALSFELFCKQKFNRDNLDIQSIKAFMGEIS